MENNFINTFDITYMSELTPPASLCEAKRRGLIRPYRFASLLREQNEAVGAH